MHNEHFWSRKRCHRVKKGDWRSKENWDKMVFPEDVMSHIRELESRVVGESFSFQRHKFMSMDDCVKCVNMKAFVWLVHGLSLYHCLCWHQAHDMQRHGWKETLVTTNKVHHIVTDKINFHKDPWAKTHNDLGWPFQAINNMNVAGTSKATNAKQSSGDWRNFLLQFTGECP